MGAPGIGDFISLANLFYDIWNFGFSRINNANKQYQELGDSIQGIAENLEILEGVEYRAEQRSPRGRPARRSPAFAHLDQTIESSRRVLASCEQFLRERRGVRKKDGFVTNLEWSFVAGPEAQDLGRQIDFLNCKLNTILHTIQLHVLDNISSLIADRTAAILRRLDQLEQSLTANGNLGIETVVEIEIPAELDSFLSIAARQEYRDWDTAPLGRCIDAAVYHFTRAKEQSRWAQVPRSPESCLLDVLISFWILNNFIKPGRDYLKACSENPTNDYDRQLEASGLGLETFVRKLQEEFVDLFNKTTLGDTTGILTKAVALFKQHPYIHWPEEIRVSLLIEPSAVTESHLDELMTAPLKARQILTLYKQDETHLTMTISTPQNIPGTIREVSTYLDLPNLDLNPMYAFPGATSKAFNMNVGKSKKQPLCFQDLQALLKFQHATTGHLVKWDGPNVRLGTPQSRFSRKLREEYGRLQIWDQIPMTKRTSSEPTGSPSQSIVSEPSPSTIKAMSDLEKRISRSTAQSAPPTESRLNRTVTSQISIIEKSVPGIRGIKPNAPHLVFFLHTESQSIESKSTKSEPSESKSLSYFSIEMAGIRINPSRCDCWKPDNECPTVVIECEGLSKLPARRFPTSNLAALGVDQRSNAPAMLNSLKHATVLFGGAKKREEFVTMFNHLRNIYNAKLSDYYAVLNGSVNP